MLLTLIKKQLLGTLSSLIRRDNKHTSLFKSVGYSLLFIYVLGILAFMSVEVMSPLCEPLIQANLNWFYFVYVFVLGFTYSVVGGIFSAKSGLYEASDNELLLSLPIPPIYILISRMIPLYLYSFLFSNLVMIPAFVVYALKASAFGLTYNIFNWIILVFVLPLLPLVVSCILGWILAKISSKFRFKNIATIVISLGFMVGYYYLISKMNDIINNAVRVSIRLGNHVSRYAWVRMIGNAGTGDVVALLVVVMVVLLIFGICCWVLSKSYVKVMTTKSGVIKTKYEKKKLHRSSVDQALFKKEWKRYSGSTIYLLNTGLGTLFLIVGIIAMLVKGPEVKPLILELFGDVEKYIALIICVAECFIVSTNGVSAPSISLEGKTLWQLQVLPISKMQILNAKLKLHLVVTAPAVVVFGIVTGNVLSLDGLSTVLLILIPSVLVVICGELGLVFNLLNPRLDYETESAAVKQSLSVLLTLFTGYALISVFIGLFVLVMDKWTVELYLGLVLGLEVIIGILLYQWLRTKGCKILETLG